MSENELKRYKEQHIDNYKSAILESIKNNTNVLVDEDLYSLLSKPPLDSMDSIKMKFLNTAKKYKIVLNTNELDNIIDSYRSDLLKCTEKIKKIRIDELSSKVNKIHLKDNNDVIKIIKKDFIVINKDIKNLLKKQLNDSFERKIEKNINVIFSSDIDSDITDKFVQEISKYVKITYQKQLLENIDIKFMVKDTTLINTTKEQADRYLFTLNHSRLLNDSIE